MKVSVVLRTYNEQRHLRALLQGIQDQITPGCSIETVIVDSGSTDNTLRIAADFPVKIVSINKADFSFGRSLNLGCAAAEGEILVFVSGHCIPATPHWIARLIEPLGKSNIVYTYGRQLGDGSSHFSEKQIFAKYFPPTDQLPQQGYYCNNANAALLKITWRDNPFDEELTGLEDMHLAKRLVNTGHSLGYVAQAPVYHLHSESWVQIRNRFEREAIALQHIMPEVHLRFLDVCRYFMSAVWLDMAAARQNGTLQQHMLKIVRYRFEQFKGAYRGNHLHRQLSRQTKEAYFYPR